MSASDLSPTDRSRLQWKEDLTTLLTEAKRRFSDVSWSLVCDDGTTTEVHGHKAIIYARSGAQFQTRYLSNAPRALTFSAGAAASTSSFALPLDSEEHASLAHSSAFRRPPSPGSLSFVSSSNHNHSPAPIVVRGTNVTFFRHCLEFLYTGNTAMNSVFPFLFDEANIANVPDNSTQGDASAKLVEDMQYIWRSKLFADVQLRIASHSDSDIPEEESVFVAHRAILCSRSTYFANLMLSAYADSSNQVYTLPSPPFSSASLHFVLGYIYAGSLQFSTRHFDLSTAFSIWRCAQYLGIDLLREEVESFIQDMCRGREGSRRAGRALRFAHAPDVQALHLANSIRPIIVSSPAETWNRDVGELDYEVQKQIVTEVCISIDAFSLISVFRASRGVAARISDEKEPWAEHISGMLEPINARIYRVLAADLKTLITTPDFINLIEGVGFSTDVLEALVETLVQSLTESSAANAYQILVGQVLLRDEGLMNNIRMIIEDGRKGIIRYIRSKWVGIRGHGAFDSLQDWALKEISDEIEIPVDDLLSPPPPEPVTPVATKSTRRSSAKKPIGSVSSRATPLRSSMATRSSTATTVAANRSNPPSRENSIPTPRNHIAQKTRASLTSSASPRPPSVAASVRSERSRMTTASTASASRSRTTGTTSSITTTATTPKRVAPKKSSSTLKTPARDDINSSISKQSASVNGGGASTSTVTRKRVSESVPKSPRPQNLAISAPSASSGISAPLGSSTNMTRNISEKSTASSTSIRSTTKAATSPGGAARSKVRKLGDPIKTLERNKAPSTSSIRTTASARSVRNSALDKSRAQTHSQNTTSSTSTSTTTTPPSPSPPLPSTTTITATTITTPTTPKTSASNKQNVGKNNTPADSGNKEGDSGASGSTSSYMSVKARAAAWSANAAANSTKTESRPPLSKSSSTSSTKEKVKTPTLVKKSSIVGETPATTSATKVGSTNDLTTTSSSASKHSVRSRMSTRTNVTNDENITITSSPRTTTNSSRRLAAANGTTSATLKSKRSSSSIKQQSISARRAPPTQPPPLKATSVNIPPPADDDTTPVATKKNGDAIATPTTPTTATVRRRKSSDDDERKVPRIEQPTDKIKEHQEQRSVLIGAEEAAPGTSLKVGIPCLVSTKDSKFQAVVKYLGEVLFDSGAWVGVEVYEEFQESCEEILAWNDGSVDGVRYFELANNSNFNNKVMGDDMDGLRMPMFNGSRPASARSFAKRAEDVVSIASQQAKTTVGLFLRPEQILFVF